MRVLVWHVHGSWLTSFLQGSHDYLLPTLPGRGPDGLGRAASWDWPASAVEMSPAELADAAVDVVVVQRPHELELATRWLGRRPGRDVAAVYLEHNTPGGDVPFTRHPLAGQSEIPVVHVTAFNALMWDCGDAPVHVVEHGIVDPGRRWTGELARAAVVLNDPVRRGRAVGSDLVEELARDTPVDLFGMRVSGFGGGVSAHESLTQAELHDALALRRVYVHTPRWTSLGLSLLEAMHLGMPAVALASTEAWRAVPPGGGCLVPGPAAMRAAVHRLLADRALAADLGAAGREHVRTRYGLARFLREWDEVLADVITR
ncbi:glycosyl transferase [Nocardioides gansuensis]|uniref:Glycosyl transferase n=1 Tax=Nocardioides gansuensis TaxID=2138300 RepID=A0A2T8F9S0_9ACTN|nr:glycosyltransferase [Nocardioides gansuensis]PVG82433.1 glycosyl transferase [Nocardioides gansuensis]